ncbi:phosphoadenosine phosphosulfate reductase family protein [Xenorhabdus bovienii]|uniref:phosphoadenosine phosphosulfate reductase family protein n=2 Tax=Xenorhabdus bovienii TaxID=40576 RepID=UPI0023B32C9A|nr:phosphoadenosine phosphosulfate reductase family protein [Xenorhabdus bovienii]MDE9443927.1 phosphoadenosine phosphosulfate reductase family protein [Xenorhabdus bovienii]MDE9548899.1 phosphoadenosine phosphosulfate reductase family protein [Xenorhabdus bovienii]
MINVVSFSGGRTSAYLVYLMEQRRKAGEDVRYVFMDTGAEHPKTYEFIRDLVQHWNIDLVCLRVVINPELGKGNGYEILSLDEITNDLKPWKAMLRKYGTPYVGGEFCTDRMKLVPFQKYCDEHIGKKSYHTWIGIRADEPKRIKRKERVSYLADISDVDKFGVIDWWSRQPFDLQIPEHLGNCCFCIKKSIQKIALAAKDEPELAAQFREILASNEVRKMENRNGTDLIMYRGKNSFDGIIQMFADDGRDELAARMPSQKQYIRAAMQNALCECQLNLF